MKATAIFEITSWDEEAYDERDGTKLSRTRAAKLFSGEVEGTSGVELLMAYADESPAAYVGFERFVARIGDRAGSFVLLHAGTMSATGSDLQLTVVPGSGAGELAGLTGSALISRDEANGHSFELDYSFTE